jgi:hypothetical protein
MRSPYLYVYESSAELDELMAMHLGAVRVEHDVHIEQMLQVSRRSRPAEAEGLRQRGKMDEGRRRAPSRRGADSCRGARQGFHHHRTADARLRPQRPHVFALYTAANSYFLQAPTERELDAWM